MFLYYFISAFLRAGGKMGAGLAGWEVVSGWGVSGFQYAMYNLFIIPAILFSIRDLETRGEVVGSAVAASVICAFPALLFQVSFLGDYPGILAQEIPVYAVITSLGVTTLLILYLVALFGTFVETGAGLIQGTIERIDGVSGDREPPAPTGGSGALAAVGVGLSALLATFGIIPLIARGYGTLAWGFFAVYVLPLLTVGIWRIRVAGPSSSPPPPGADPQTSRGAGGGAGCDLLDNEAPKA